MFFFNLQINVFNIYGSSVATDSTNYPPTDT